MRFSEQAFVSPGNYMNIDSPVGAICPSQVAVANSINWLPTNTEDRYSALILLCHKVRARQIDLMQGVPSLRWKAEIFQLASPELKFRQHVTRFPLNEVN